MSIFNIEVVIEEGQRRHPRSVPMYRQRTMARMPVEDRVDAAAANRRWTDHDERALRILAGVR